MSNKVLITCDSHYFKTGQVVEGKLTKTGLLIKEHLINEGSFIVLTEALSTQDEEKVKHIIRDMLKRFFYRQYTRSSFLLK